MPKLKRLVLYEEYDGIDDIEWQPANLFNSSLQVEFLFNFVSKMKHLSAVCISVNLNPQVIEVLETRFIQEIVPNRPAFWFQLGALCPWTNHSLVPRVHYDEIVSPINYFSSPPKFD